MPQNYYDMTGVLRLQACTPIIQAIFGCLKLDANFPGEGQAYIAEVCEDNSADWDSIIESLADVAAGRGIEIDDPSDGAAVIGALAKALCPDKDATSLTGLVSSDSPDLYTLFELAAALDDGHGLEAIQAEGAWHCNKPRLFEFGGHGMFMSREFSHSGSSTEAMRLGETVFASLKQGNVDEVVHHLQHHMRKIIDGIADQSTREAVAARLSIPAAPVAAAD